MSDGQPKAPLLSRARVPVLATLAIGVSALAIWQGTRGGDRDPKPPDTPVAPASPAPPEASVPEVPVADEQEAMGQFIDGIERMLEAAEGPSAQGGAAGDTLPLPLPEPLQDAPRDEQLGYYRELLQHGEAMLELNRPHMSPAQLAEAEDVLGRLRERLGAPATGAPDPRVTAP